MGTARMTENGTDQLSYRAARQRNTTRMEMAYRNGAWVPACTSWKEAPVHS